MSEAAIEALAQGGSAILSRCWGRARGAVTALARSGETLAAFRRVHVAGLFEAEISERPDYRLCIDWDGVIQETEELLGELDVYLLAEERPRQCRVPPPCSPTGASSSARIPRAIWSRPERSGVPPNRSGESERRRPLPTDTGFSTGSSDARYREAG